MGSSVHCTPSVAHCAADVHDGGIPLFVQTNDPWPPPELVLEHDIPSGQPEGPSGHDAQALNTAFWQVLTPGAPFGHAHGR